MALVAGETLFVDLYLIGATAFAHNGNGRFARFSAEIAGVESEHRVLAENVPPPVAIKVEHAPVIVAGDGLRPQTRRSVDL